MVLLLACLLAAEPTVLDGVDVTGWTTQQLWDLSDKYFHDGQYAEAVRLHQRICRLDPSDVESYGVAAWLLWSLGDEPAARRMLVAGVKANPDTWDSHWELGFHDMERNGDIARAIPSLELAVAQEGWPPYAIRTLAHAYEFAEQPTRAAAVWERIGNDGLAPPGIVNNNLGNDLEMALRSDMAARLGGALVGEPHPERVIVLADRTIEVDDQQEPWVRTIALESADDADGVPDMRITMRGHAVVYKRAWRWVSIDADVNRDGRFSLDEMLLDPDGDGIAESLPDLETMRLWRSGLLENSKRLLTPDRYELGVDSQGRAAPLTVEVRDGRVIARPPCYLATDREGLILRLVLVEAVHHDQTIIATTPLPPGVYCGNQSSGEPRIEVALPLDRLPAGRWAVALEIGYRTAVLDRKLLPWLTLERDAEGATLTRGDAWALFEPPEEPADPQPETSAAAAHAHAANEQGHTD